MKDKTIRLQKEIIRENCYDLRVGKDFLNKISKINSKPKKREREMDLVTGE